MTESYETVLETENGWAGLIHDAYGWCAEIHENGVLVWGTAYQEREAAYAALYTKLGLDRDEYAG